MRLAGCIAGLALLPRAAAAVTLTPADGLALCALPPSLEADPFDGGRAFAACWTVPGAFAVSVDPALPLGFAGVSYFLSAALDCSESGGAQPQVGSLYLESGLARGWLTTSGCDLAVPFDAATGADWPLVYDGSGRLAVPTRRLVTGAFTTYEDGGPGEAVASFETRFTAAVARAGDRLLVATSNLKTAGSDPEMFPGTVLLFDIDDSGPQPAIAPADPPYVITSDPNPTALTVLPGGLVAVTNTGLLDVAFPPLVTGPGSVDVLDPAAGALIGSFPLGPNPGGRRLAVDPTGSVAVATSHTLRALFAFDVRGLAALPRSAADPTLQRPSCHDVPGPEAGGVACLRERVIHGTGGPLALPPPPGAMGASGFVPQVRFAASGDFLAATSFNDGGLAVLAFDGRNLDRPHPLLPSRFGPPETLAAAPPPGFGTECCPGPLLLADDAGGSDGADAIWLTASPVGVVARGALAGTPAPATGDFDGDGVEDAVDVCPVEPDPAQLDSGSTGGGGADGVGDACQCGDVDGDGVAGAGDAASVQAELAGPPGALAFPDKCDVDGDGSCTIADVVRVARADAGLGPGLVQGCAPAVP